MSQGTSEIVARQALVTALRARGALASVQVLYAQDDFVASDDALKNEAIWLGDTEWLESEIPVMKSGTKKVDEVYEIGVTIQVIKDDGSSQEVTDQRAQVLLVEVQQALAEAPKISAEVFWALWRTRKHVTGQLATGPGHGARYEGVVEVRARLF